MRKSTIQLIQNYSPTHFWIFQGCCTSVLIKSLNFALFITVNVPQVCKALGHFPQPSLGN